MGVQNKSLTARQLKLWIDGVGCWLAHWDTELVLGGPSASPPHLRLEADLSREHLRINRIEEEYCIQPRGDTRVNQRLLQASASLRDGDELGLGTEVRLLFRIPSALSRSAVLVATSEHRFADHLDGVLLIDQHCLLGPGAGVHLFCPDWERQMVLFVRGERLWCRADEQLQYNGLPLTSAQPLQSGVLLSSDRWRLRCEAV